ncbi:MAG: hypothetical protein H7329_00180 [Opitutaceae bacterium]|nr:hypothetical protein [Cytophagales bacterium]
MPILISCMKYFTICLLLLISQISFAQKHEFGLSVGASNYKGDYTNDNFEVRNYSPALLLFYKNNITPAFGLRYHLMGGIIRANDGGSSDPVYVARGQSFSNLLGEGALQLEYNFLNYRSETNKFKWSPYFLGGLGVYYSSPLSGNAITQIQPCIPIGLGIKFIFKNNWNIGLEAAARKTFTDMLDNANGETYGGNSDTKDWYLYNGITISYSLYDVYCPKPGR